MTGFIDQQLELLRIKLEGKIDFVGQERVEELSRTILWSSAIISFIIGAIVQKLSWTMSIFASGVIICCLTVIPSYPSYNQHPVKWLPPLDQYGELLPMDTGTEVEAGAAKESKKNK